MARKMRFRFSHRSPDGRYWWYSTTTLPGDSRVEQVSCNVNWFWGNDVSRMA